MFLRSTKIRPLHKTLQMEGKIIYIWRVKSASDFISIPLRHLSSTRTKAYYNFVCIIHKSTHIINNIKGIHLCKHLHRHNAKVACATRYRNTFIKINNTYDTFYSYLGPVYQSVLAIYDIPRSNLSAANRPFKFCLAA